MRARTYSCRKCLCRGYNINVVDGQLLHLGHELLFGQEDQVVPRRAFPLTKSMNCLVSVSHDSEHVIEGLEGDESRRMFYGMDPDLSDNGILHSDDVGGETNSENEEEDDENEEPVGDDKDLEDDWLPEESEKN